MGKQLIIQDVCDVIITDLVTGKVAANTYMQMSSLEGTINEEDLRAGIGNGKIFKIRSEKDLNLNFRSAVFDSEWLAMTQGVTVNSTSVEVTRTERLIIKAGKITILGTPVGNTVTLTDADGSTNEAAATSKEVTVPIGFTLKDGDDIIVVYKENVTGEGIEFDATKFSSKYKVELRTISYDLNTAEIYSDIYFIFPECLSGGDFNFSFEAGSVITPEISFSVLQPRGSTVMGQMIDVPRVKAP